MHRFMMDLTNPNSRASKSGPSTHVIAQISIANAGKSVSKQPTALNAPMIERVYKTRPGCSACGKKVA